MDAFLKEILEPSERAAFDYLTRVEAPSANRSCCADYALLSANIGLPCHLIERQPSRSAYTTHTSHVVKMLVKQDERRKAVSHRPAETEPNSEPQEAGFEEENRALSQLSRGSSTPGTGEDSVEMSTAERSLPLPSVCNRVIFARKPHLHVLPRSSLAHFDKKK